MTRFMADEKVRFGQALWSEFVALFVRLAGKNCKLGLTRTVSSLKSLLLDLTGCPAIHSSSRIKVSLRRFSATERG